MSQLIKKMAQHLLSTLVMLLVEFRRPMAVLLLASSLMLMVEVRKVVNCLSRKDHIYLHPLASTEAVHLTADAETHCSLIIDPTFWNGLSRLWEILNLFAMAPISIKRTLLGQTKCFLCL